MNDLQTVLSLLHKLSKSDRSEVIARCSSLGAKAALTNTQARLYGIIRSGVSGAIPPYSVTCKMQSYKRFFVGLEIFDGFVRRAFPGIGYNERNKIYAELVHCILDHLKIIKKPVTKWHIEHCLVNIEDIVEESYPGYLDAGVLKSMLLGE
jgi:hypothetical protein